MVTDSELAPFIVRHMLTHKKLDLEIIKANFNLTDLTVREALIRLYFKGKVFGKIVNNFLMFNEKASNLALEDVIDLPLGGFDLERLILESKSESVQLEGTNLDQGQLYHQHMQIQSSSEIDYGRRKETFKDEPIIVETRFGFIGYKLKLKLLIHNNSIESIFNAKIRLTFPSTLQFVSIHPESDKEIGTDSISVEIGDIHPNAPKSWNILFNQTKEKIVSISGIFQYTNNEGFARLIKIDQSSTEFILPKFIAGTLIADDIQPFMKNPKNFKHILAFGVPKSLSATQAQSYMETAVINMGFIEIFRLSKEELTMAFYSGRVESSGHPQLDVLIVPQVKNEIMEIYAVCQNDQIVVSLLRTIAFHVETLMMDDNILRSGVILVNLNCINCNSVLLKNPKKNEEIICHYCRIKQIPWLEY